MSDYYISQIQPDDSRGNLLVENLLRAEGIRKDANLDYTCGLFDEDMNLVATGSCFGNTLRCMAVSSSHQGRGLMNQIVTHLMEVQVNRGHTHLFLYTKRNSATFFGDLGFYEIVRAGNQIVFMENRKHGFQNYLNKLVSGQMIYKHQQRAAALVMNANPFTLGHLHLVEKASAENDVVHLFIISEDASLVPFEVRKKLVMEGTTHLKNICFHDSGPYIISNATFPSYFQKDEAAVIESHAMVDISIFTMIAPALGITCRYVGEEPDSQVTGIYNRIMSEQLPAAGIRCVVIPRREQNGSVISASTVRRAIKENKMELVRSLVPESTYRYFLSEEAKPVIDKIYRTQNVIHY